jgi:hypothetical protein
LHLTRGDDDPRRHQHHRKHFHKGSRMV